MNVPLAGGWGRARARAMASSRHATGCCRRQPSDEAPPALALQPVQTSLSMLDA